MTWRVMALATVVALTLSRIALAAGKQDVQALYYMCKKTGTTEYWICAGFVGGVADLMGLFPVGPRDREPALKAFSMCASPSHGAMVQAFINWAETHPEQWDQPQVNGVVQALRSQWPCP